MTAGALQTSPRTPLQRLNEILELEETLHEDPQGLAKLAEVLRSLLAKVSRSAEASGAKTQRQ